MDKWTELQRTAAEAVINYDKGEVDINEVVKADRAMSAYLIEHEGMEAAHKKTTERLAFLCMIALTKPRLLDVVRVLKKELKELETN